MKKIIVIVLTIVAAIGGLVFYRSQTPSATQAIAELPKGTVVIDVRTPEEFAAGHAQGAQNFPVEKMQDGNFPTVAKTTPIALYCHSGRRAGIALELMKKQGFTKVQSLGGIDALPKYSLAIVTS